MTAFDFMYYAFCFNVLLKIQYNSRGKQSKCTDEYSTKQQNISQQIGITALAIMATSVELYVAIRPVCAPVVLNSSTTNVRESPCIRLALDSVRMRCACMTLNQVIISEGICFRTDQCHLLLLTYMIKISDRLLLLMLFLVQIGLKIIDN